MGMYADAASGLLLNAMRGVFAADTETLSMFGAEGIRRASYEELEGPIRPPCLYVVGGLQSTTRVVSNKVGLDFEVGIYVYLPRQTPVDQSITASVAPTAVAGAAGVLTGTYLYRVTGCTDYGDSYASPYGTVALTAQKGSLTLPTISGAAKRRIWRTQANRIGFFYLETVHDNTTTTYLDNLPDSKLGAEMAPIQSFADNVKDYLRTVVYANETLPLASVNQADRATLMKDEKDGILTSRNLRVIKMKAVFRSEYDVLTGQIDAEVP